MRKAVGSVRAKGPYILSAAIFSLDTYSPGGLEETRGCQKTIGSSGAHAKDADRTGSNLLENAVAKQKSDAMQDMIDVIDLTGKAH